MVLFVISFLIYSMNNFFRMPRLIKIINYCTVVYFINLLIISVFLTNKFNVINSGNLLPWWFYPWWMFDEALLCMGIFLFVICLFIQSYVNKLNYDLTTNNSNTINDWSGELFPGLKQMNVEISLLLVTIIVLLVFSCAMFF